MTRMNDVRQRTLSEQEGIVLDEERVEHVRHRLESLFHDRDLAAVESGWVGGGGGGGRERERERARARERARKREQAVGKARHRAPSLD